jgi:hypothetical protein
MLASDKKVAMASPRSNFDGREVKKIDKINRIVAKKSTTMIDAQEHLRA